MESGGLLFVCGCDPVWGDDVCHGGIVGCDLDTAEALEAARLATLNVLAHLAAAGDLDRVRPLKLTAHVRAAGPVPGLHRVMDTATTLLAELYGALPALTVVGATGLARGIAVEVEAIFERASGPARARTKKDPVPREREGPGSG